MLSKLKNPEINSPIGGFATFDDCGIHQINDTQSIIQTLDFFTPIVDDPYLFGQIAATNALSDIYAMGGTPIFALNIAAFPSNKLSLNILSEILQGGIDKCNEANISILGGHTIKDDIPKYGLAVTGLINNNDIIKNNTAKENDDIILTKPIGSGIISTAIKKGLVKKEIEKQATSIMNTLNNKAAKIMLKHNANACTDVTGFGLLGHLNEICKGSNLSAIINYKNIPLISDVEKFAKNKIVPGGTKNNFLFLKDDLYFSESIQEYKKLILADAQTSGGLIIACNKSNTKNILLELNQKSSFKSKLIGEFKSKQEYNIYCKR
ncbi:MAG: selenide, water dikinase SelD [Candidatus Marinimicrobia bacterium]|nr:selenide, water dikinase SelD [Candidatus Neomarinimicrobiota bacterium]